MEVMKQLRQGAIRDLVGQRPLRTQQELAAALRERGFRATQATISRDVAELGLVKASQRDIVKAEEYFDKSMELKPKDAQVYLNLGSVYDRLLKPEKSYKAYALALQARPEWSEARFKVASVLAGKGMCPDAVSLLKAAPAQDRQFQQIYDYCRSH